MKIKCGEGITRINTMSNWPLVVDLFVKWGYPEELLETAKLNEAVLIKVSNIDKIINELSAWGIPWKKEF